MPYEQKKENIALMQTYLDEICIIGFEMEVEFAEIFDHYLTSYSDRNWELLKPLFSEDLTGFGTGPDENSFYFTRFQDLYEREIQQIPDKLVFDFQEKKIQPLTEKSFIGLANLNITVTVEGESMTILGVRLSCVFKKEQSRWKLAHKHISAPISVQDEGETVPVKELQHQNQILEEKVQEKTRALQEINTELAEKNRILQETLDEITTLKKLLPICSHCKKIRDDEGYWQSVEQYLTEHTEIKLTHSLCNECIKIYLPEFKIEKT